MPSVHLSRRRFVGVAGAALASGLLAPKKSFGATVNQIHPDALDDKEFLRHIGRRAVEAATAAGASYADARVTIVKALTVSRLGPVRQEQINVGVRALVDGYWGFASSPVVHPDEAARMGTDAARQANAHGIGLARRVELAPMSKRESGDWTMPIEIDPFTIPYEEMQDFVVGLENFAQRLRIREHSDMSTSASVSFLAIRNDKVFVSSEGQETTQRLYCSHGSVSITVSKGRSTRVTRPIRNMELMGMGWENMTRRPLDDLIREAQAEAVEEIRMPLGPVDIGRFNILFPARTVGEILSSSIGRATELDRIVGFEANASGTSYITDPAQVGSLSVGHPGMRVVANQSIPGSVGLCRWDDEGVTPRPVTLVEKGVIVGMQTSRELAGWQDPNAESHGCAVSNVAYTPPVVGAGDIELQPGTDSSTLDSLRKGMNRGIELSGDARIQFDFQQSTAMMTGVAYRIANGRRIERLVGCAISFRSPEFWKNVIASGGPASAQRFGLRFTKGEPAIQRYHSVSAPPLVVKELAVMDVQRKV
jgi:TldD protein